MLWHLTEAKRALRFEGHTAEVCGVRFAPSGSLLASASRDGTVRFWMVNKKDESRVLRAHIGAGVRSLDFSPDGHSLATASDDMTVKVWSVQRQSLQQTITAHSNWVHSVRFSSDGRLLASCSDDKTLSIWDVGAKTSAHCFTDSGK
ncbi:hypothetical protein HPB48_000549 [Haemaphysalis longicornis]|uniref:Uncharacterized protein n=1 Tax=Haemaphysalis longicornis TaxID=44386 RepID=A0A9J6FM57_HAELO|nr:hypothetical protein HPB48_000549 [Haemaphysalis longicornis]